MQTRRLMTACNMTPEEHRPMVAPTIDTGGATTPARDELCEDT